MKRIVWIIIAVAVGGYFFNSYTVKKAKREAEAAETNRIEQATKSAVSQMASRTNAVSDWTENLSKGESLRFEPILTVELERLWLQQRPILFVGSIKDIATHDHSQYVVLIERSPYSSYDYMFGTELQLSLFSSKELIDSLIKKHPDLFKDYEFKNGVAVVARINAIRTTSITGKEGDREEVKIGDGELLDIQYTGDVTF